MNTTLSMLRVAALLLGLAPAVLHAQQVTEDFTSAAQTQDGDTLGACGQLTVRLASTGTVAVKGDGAARIATPTEGGAAMLCSTHPLPSGGYRVAVKITSVAYPKYTSENAVTLLAVTDGPPTPGTEAGWMGRRVVGVEVDSKPHFEDDSSCFVNYWDPKGSMYTWDGGKWTLAWKPHFPSKSAYEVAIEKTATHYMLEVSSGGTTIAKAQIPVGSVLPPAQEYLVLGDRITDFSRGAMEVDSIEMPAPAACAPGSSDGGPGSSGPSGPDTAPDAGPVAPGGDWGLPHGGDTWSGSGFEPGGDSAAENHRFVYGGGRGCSVHGGDRYGALALLPLALLLLLRRRRRSCSLMVVLALLAPAAARADGVQFSVLRYQPPASGTGFLVTERARTLPHMAPAAGIMLGYAHRPLEIVNPATGSTDERLVSYQVNLNLLAALGLFDRFEIGLDVPLTLGQGSDDLQVIARPPGTTPSAGVGDLRVIPRARIGTWDSFSLGLSAPVLVPTGSQEDFLGDGGVGVQPTLLLSADLGSAGVGLNVGYRFRDDRSFVFSEGQRTVVVDDEVVVSVGVQVTFLDGHLTLLADGSAAVAAAEQDQEEICSELLAGVRVRLPWNLTLNLAGGPGLSRGVGTPAFRLLAGLGYVPASEPKPRPQSDRDGDGLPDRADRCPDRPEDRDRFKDRDGCPDPDNDSDTILDRDDPCPDDPEDVDGFEDQDGCPDLDNDNDTILDRDDRCPLKPETFNDNQDEDGCPDETTGPVGIRRGRIEVPPVYFATDEDTILRRSHPTLLEVVETLKRNTWIRRVHVAGHTDSRGTDGYNDDLSSRRVLSVVRFLLAHGVAADRLEGQGHGESRPVASNRTRSGRSRNRRVEFIIIDPRMESEGAGGAGDDDGAFEDEDED